MKTSVKVVVGLAVVGGLVALVLVSRSRSTEETLKIEADAVAARDLTSIVEASGQIEPKVSVDISSDVIGRIVDMGVDEGDVVHKGQFLIQVDPTQFEQRAARLEAELASTRTSLQEAQANLVIRKAEFERDRRLFDAKLIPLSQYESSEAAHEVAVAQVASARNRIKQAEASLREARDNLARCRIVAPMDGVVIRKNAEIGETAISGTINNQGSLLLTIADLSVMQTEVDVDETDVVHVRLGQEADVGLDAFPSRTFKGEVTRIANSAVQNAGAPGQRQSVDYKVEVTLKESDERIRPGLSATARIATASRKSVLSVPIQALVVRAIDEDEPDSSTEEAPVDSTPAASSGVAMAADHPVNPEDQPEAAETKEPEAAGEGDATGKKKRDEKEGVFVVREGHAVFVPIETGIAGEKYFEVIGTSLEEGDQVVSGNFSALRRLKDGDAVEIEKKTDDDE